MNLIAVLFLLAVVGRLTIASPPIYLNLGHKSWTVENQNLSIKVRASVPGGIYSDLRNAGVFTQDFFYRFNDVEYRWVAKENWTYSTSFDVSSEILKKESVILEFEGLDTVSNVVLNGNVLGQTNNMFVLYQFNVKEFLQEKSNQLKVQFTSPIWAAEQATTEISYPIPPSCVPLKYHGECHVNYLRKMQASFAWDWGPAFPSVGIWKNVTLQAYNKAHAQYVAVETKPDSKTWKVSATLYLDVKGYTSGTLTATLVLEENNITNSRQVSISPQDNKTSIVLSVPKDSVKMWWPNGFGSQPLYILKVSFSSEQEASEKTVKIGFRTIKLVQIDAVPNEPKKGLSFFFRVNGLPIFAKGSNYIPAHVLPELGADPERLRRILTSARDTHMNMLRVWGGGVYESDLFYEMCDELGLMIWQDMMFACGMYPTSEQFLNSVSAEVTHNVLRLQHHASIAVWAGNNENEAALAGNWYDTQTNYSLYKEDYVKLYVDTIRPVVLRLDKTRSYVLSSPSNGLESEREGYVAKNPYDLKYGDLHYYEYVFNLWNPAIVPKTRFASEYGTMSLPSLNSLANVSLPEDLSLSSAFMKFRQHHPAGYSQITAEIKQNMYLPNSADLDTFIYLSQINQAMSMKTETEGYRRGRNQINSIGEGLTMGALYWQLNDVWQAPSWSSTEFGGKWKMLHYFVADFFSPILVSPSIDVTNQLKVHVISDLKLHNKDLIMQMYVYNWQSFDPVFIQHYHFTMLGAGVVEIGSWNMRELLQSIEGCKSNIEAEKNCFFYFSVLTSNGTTTLGPDNFYFPTPLHSVSAVQANIQVEDVKAMKNNQELIITLSSDVIAPFVWLDTNLVSGHFSHNGFLLVTNKTQLTFTSEQPVDVKEFKSSLKVRSLMFNKQ